MPGCAAFGCSNRAEDGFLMKVFPKDPKRRELWAAKVKRKDWKPTNYSFLCEVHFAADQWEKTRVDGTRKLKCNAVPSIFSFVSSKKPRKIPNRGKVLISETLRERESPVTATIERVVKSLSAKFEMSGQHLSKRCTRIMARHLATATQGPFNFVGGKRIPPLDPTYDITVIQPATGKCLCVIPNSGPRSVNDAVQAAKEAFPQWSSMGSQKRGHLLTAAAKKIREQLEEIAQLEVADTGKPIWEARIDIAGCADVLEYYGGIAPSISGFHHSLPNGNFAIVQREPLGVVAGIGAWNYPFQVMMWKVAPAIMCGNTFVYKPSQLTPVTSVVLAEILNDVGVPSGVVNVVQGDGDTGKSMCNHPDVAKLTFTGSVPTGKSIMKSCAEGMKKITLELGGKSALLIFSDCDLVDAVKATLLGNFLTQGEVCSNCTRVYVERPILKPFLELLVEATRKLVVGDPLSENTTVGAVITESHGQKILEYIETAKKEGAHVLCGGKRVKLQDPSFAGGCYISPCVISNCSDNMTVVKEEIFGPVVSVLSFDTEEEAVFRANNTPYGLAGGVMTKDIQRGHRVASKLQAGIVWINNYNVFPPEVPFGGYKMSGFGRENGLAAVDDFTQLKTIYVEMSINIDCPIYRI